MTHEDNFHNCPKLIFKQSVTLVLRAMDKCAAPRPQEIQQAVVSEDDSPFCRTIIAKECTILPVASGSSVDRSACRPAAVFVKYEP
jgi:hypothetical protein